MGITHSFVSAKSDGGDATLVRPSDWNAEHAVDGLAGAMTHSYLGYNTVGGSAETMIQWRVYATQITLTAPALIASIGAHVRGKGSTDQQLRVGVWADSSGSPSELLATNGATVGTGGLYLESVAATDGNYRWLHIPVGIYLTAGTYWIGVQAGGTSDCDLKYDGSGSDKYWTSTIDDITDGGSVFSISTSSNRYSIRANAVSSTVSSEIRAFIGCRIRRSTNQSISSGSEQVITFDTESYDTDGFHSTVSNTSRITIPAGLGGKYRITANVEWASDANGYRFIYIKKNGSAYIGGSSSGLTASVSYASHSLTVDADLVAGDYIEVYALQNSGGGINVVSQTDYSPVFSIHKLDSGKVGSGIGARIKESTAQSVVTATDTVLTSDEEDFDTDGFHSVSSNTSRMTIPTGLGGKYLINANVVFANNSTGIRVAAILLNGATVLGNQREPAGGQHEFNVSTIYNLVPGDYVEVLVHQTSGGNLNVTLSNFSLMRLDSGSATLASDRAKRTAGDLTTTSTTFVDATSMSVTITTGAHRCMIAVAAVAELSSASPDDICLDIDVDGSRLGGTFGSVDKQVFTANRRENLSFTTSTDVLSAGSHTFKLQWRVSAGTGTLYAGSNVPLVMTVTELPA